MIVRVVITLLLAASLAGCGGERPKRSVVLDDATRAQEAERMFDTAVRTMEKMGRVERADRNRRLIHGVTGSGVAMEIEILILPGAMPDLSVQASVPSGVPGGKIDEPERFMTLFRQSRKPR